jgi:hypothetical protein
MNQPLEQHDKPSSRPLACPVGRGCLEEDDCQAVLPVNDGHWLDQGPTVCAFEEVLVELCAVQDAFVISSGTAALQVTCLSPRRTRTLGWHSTLNEAELASARRDLMENQPVRRTMGARGQELVGRGSRVALRRGFDRGGGVAEMWVLSSPPAPAIRGRASVTCERGAGRSRESGPLHWDAHLPEPFGQCGGTGVRVLRGTDGSHTHTGER